MRTDLLRAGIHDGNVRKTNKPIPQSEEELSTYLKKMHFAEYMSDPSSITTVQELKVLARRLSIPYTQLERWKKSPKFQALVATRLRQKSFAGDILSEAYKARMRMLEDESVEPKVKAKLISDLERTVTAREKIVLDHAYRLEKMKGKKSAKKDRGKPVEQLIQEVEYEEVE